MPAPPETVTVPGPGRTTLLGFRSSLDRANFANRKSKPKTNKCSEPESYRTPTPTQTQTQTHTHTDTHTQGRLSGQPPQSLEPGPARVPTVLSGQSNRGQIVVKIVVKSEARFGAARRNALGSTALAGGTQRETQETWNRRMPGLNSRFKFAYPTRMPRPDPVAG